MSYRAFSEIFLLFSYFLCGKTISIIVLPFFVYFQYIYTARQFRQLSYRVPSRIRLAISARQFYRLSYREKELGKTISRIVLPVFKMPKTILLIVLLPSFIFFIRNCHYTHTYTHWSSRFSKFSHKLAVFDLVFQVLCSKNLLVW